MGLTLLARTGIFLGVIVLLGVIGFCVWYFTKKDDNDGSTGGSTQTLRVTIADGTGLSGSNRLGNSNRRGVLGADELHRTLEVEELQYYLTSLSMVDQLTFNDGGGWTAANSKTLSIIAPPEGLTLEAMDAYDHKTAELDTDPTHYLDLMNPSAVRERFQVEVPLSVFDTVTGGSVSAETAFPYVIVNWMGPVKVKATAKAYNAETGEYEPVLYTKAGSSYDTVSDAPGPSGDAISKTVTRAREPLNVGPSEQTVVSAGAGSGSGYMIKLLDPAVQSRLQAAPHTLYLLFDAFQSLRASTSPRTFSTDKLASEGGNLRDADGRFFNLGPLALTPLLLAEGETVTKERYRINRGDDLGWDLLLQLYVVEGSVRAVDLGVIPKPGQEELPDAAPLVTYGIQYVDYDPQTQVYTFSGFDQVPLIDGFQRLVLDQTGGPGLGGGSSGAEEEGVDTVTPTVQARLVSVAFSFVCTVRCQYLMCNDGTVADQPEVMKTMTYGLMEAPVTLELE